MVFFVYGVGGSPASWGLIAHSKAHHTRMAFFVYGSGSLKPSTHCPPKVIHTDGFFVYGVGGLLKPGASLFRQGQ
jgi:hypothetical protein